MSGIVLWDFDGTLAERPGRWRGCLLEVLQEEEPGFEADAEAFIPALRSRFPWHRPDEAHLDLCEADIWWGLLAPKNLPPAVRRAIHAAVTDALAEPALRRIYEAEGAVPSPGPYDEFAAVLRADMDRWRKVAEAANIRME